MLRMALRTLGPKAAAELDAELMSTGGFSIDQLMELAGLSVAQAIYRYCPPSSQSHKTRSRVLIAAGPGNNGGDGLVAARHLHHFHYRPTVYYPKRPSKDIYQRLTKQLEQLSIPLVEELPSFDDFDLVVDSVFGFSFSGEVREPFPQVIAELARTTKKVMAVDAPSSWNIESGPPAEGVGSEYMPSALISLTAPKPLVKFFRGEKHYVGGRFLSREVAEKFGIDVPKYDADEQVVEVPVESGKL